MTNYQKINVFFLSASIQGKKILLYKVVNDAISIQGLSLFKSVREQIITLRVDSSKDKIREVVLEKMMRSMRKKSE